MNINNLDIIQTRDLLQSHVKSDAVVTLKGVTIFKMNFKELFTIVENREGKRIYIPKDQTEFKNLAEQIQVNGQPLEIIYSESPIRPTYETCPVCNGTGTINSNICINCGGQYNDGIAKGVVVLNSDGNPCTHNYLEEPMINTFTQFRCLNCMDTYHKDL